MHDISLLVLYFFVYAFIGWLYELICYWIIDRRVKTTGFLRIPILPIYGLGALAILYLVSPLMHNPVLLFVGSAVIATVIEYVSHILIEKLFRVQLWNYDDNKFNFQGRIALAPSIAFGLLALALVYVIHPFLVDAVGLLPHTWAIIIASVLAAVLVIDTANSVISLTRLRFVQLPDLAEIPATLWQQLKAVVPLPDDVLAAPGRIRRALGKLHQANLRRLEKAFPQARRRSASGSRRDS